MKKLFLGMCLCLPACLEPQPAPDLDSRSLSEFNIESVASGLNTPWSAAVLPSGDYLVTEKAGALKFVSKDGRVSEIKGLPDDIFTEQQAGLFDVVLSPDFSETNHIYLVYARGTADKNAVAIYLAKLNGSVEVDNLTLKNGETIFTAGPYKDTSAHFGGRLAFMPGGQMMLSTGDGFLYREAAQDKDSHLGKILRLEPNGKPANDNPFVKEGDAAVYSYGHRNVQGLTLDAETGQLWAHEHGPRGGDELNLISAGANYGWPLATTGTDYNGAKITPFKTFSEGQAFVHDWVPSIAPSGLVIYRGDMFPEWDGDALVGGLASKDLRRVDLENGKSMREEILLSDIKARIRDVRIDKDGALLLVVNKSKDGEPGGGALLRITPKTP